MIAKLATLLPHYPSPGERSADAWVHAVGLAGAAVGGLVMLGISLHLGRLGTAAAVAIYAGCLVVMFLASAAYNLAAARRRPLLRRLDHAAIFLMIAGSYTPFTTQALHGWWAIGMTTTVWSLALAAAAAKLFAPGLQKGFWVVLYLALGWLVVVAIRPLAAGLSPLALGLLVAGGLIYTAGVFFYARRTLPFRRAIWHGFVVAGAAVHFAAVMAGVVLSPA